MTASRSPSLNLVWPALGCLAIALLACTCVILRTFDVIVWPWMPMMVWVILGEVGSVGAIVLMQIISSRQTR